MQEAQSHEGESVNGCSFGCLAIALFPILTVSLVAALIYILAENGVHVGRDEAATIWTISPIMVILSMCLVYLSMSASAAGRKKVRLEREAQKEAMMRRLGSKCQLDRLAKTAYDNNVKIYHGMKNLSEFLSSTNLHLKLAVELYQEGKIQLFWSNTEKACIKFAWCWRKVVAISSLTRKHAYLIEEMRSVGGDPRAYSYPFAIFETDHVKSALLNAANNIVDVMRAAQKNSNAAQMWEHYRTNDSVIGFANLGMFMSNIEEVIANSVELTSRDVNNSNRRVGHIIQTVTANSSHVARASKEQIAALQKLFDCVKKIERDICHQNWEYCSIEPLSPERPL